MRSRSAVALVSQLVSKSTTCHVHVATILTLNRDRQRPFLPEIKFMRHFHQGTQTDPNTETSQLFGRGINEELHKSISDMPSTEILYNCPN